ncbi:MAG: serine--tRNA ligase [Puniceicoccales bacterium]|jgi:seryl-tRNA synthetase|nr:serine--tRNA ligase [Puniceicoccales bacterium]
MLSLEDLRRNSDAIKNGVSRKKFHCDIDKFLSVDCKRREYVAKFEAMRAEQNVASDKIAALQKGSREFLDAVASLRELSLKVKESEAKIREIDGEWKSLYLSIPNVPHESVPIGKTEKDNVAISSWEPTGGISEFAMPHYDIPWFSKAIDFPRGVKVSGAGFPFYIGDMARLVRALLAFFLDEAKSNGYTEFLCPILVNPASATATGQLPDKEGMMYHVTGDNLYCIPTAEVPLTNFFRDEILGDDDLPILCCGHTPCFRREAGSWGKDVRGLNRLHQFDKVELVKLVCPSESFNELEKLRADAERILQKLEIPYRVLSICTGDIGFAHSKQYDLEVWAGGQKRWLEVSSCSNFTDFQARRGGIKFHSKADGKAHYVHTLNGSGLAIPRVLAAILENNLQKDLSIAIPEILVPHIGNNFLKFPMP